MDVLLDLIKVLSNNLAPFVFDKHILKCSAGTTLQGNQEK